MQTYEKISLMDFPYSALFGLVSYNDPCKTVDGSEIPRPPPELDVCSTRRK